MGKSGATLTQVFTRARGEDVSFRCQNKNPREELGPGYLGDVTHQKRGLRFEKKQLNSRLVRRLTFRAGPAQTTLCGSAPRVGCAES